MSQKYEVVYNSDLIIRDSSEAATICVFYDRVVLPFTSRESSRELIGPNVQRQEYLTDIVDWDLLYGTLFDTGVLSRLEPWTFSVQEDVEVEQKYMLGHSDAVHYYLECPRELQKWPAYHDGAIFHDERFPEYTKTDEYYYFGPEHGRGWGFDWLSEGDEILDFREVNVIAWNEPTAKSAFKTRLLRVAKARWSTRIKKVTKNVHKHVDVSAGVSDLLAIHVDRYDSGNKPLIRSDLARHFLRTDIDIPQIFKARDGRTSHDILVALEAKSTFRYLLPKLNVYHPSQILDLRDQVKDTREGFTMHLWKLSKGLAERAKGGASVGEVAGFADDLIKTELIPDYREFQRQFESIRVQKWGKVLDAAGKIVEIDAAPWTPKFWARVAKAIGLSVVAGDADKVEHLSNKYQAYKFMSFIEKSKTPFG